MDGFRMTWIELVWKNMGRRLLRTGVTVTGVAIAIAALFSLVAFQHGYRTGMQGELDRLGAHILVVPKGCPYDAASIALHGASWPCYLQSAYLKEVREAPGVGTAAPVFMNAVYGSTGEQTVYAGISPDIRALKRGWRWSGAFPERRGDLLVGADTARTHGWTVGQEVELPGLAPHRGTVAGVLAPSGGADDGFVYMRLEDAQGLFKHPGELTHILVRLADPDRLDQAVANLRGCDAGLQMNVVPLSHLFATIRSLLQATRVLFGCVVLIALGVGAAGVSNTVLMAVTERTREIGTMRALGASTGDIFRIFWLESLLVCTVGGVLGIAVAFAASRLTEAWLRTRLPFAPTDPLIRWEWGTAGLCLLAALAVGSLAGLLPAWRAARLAPMDAIRAGS
jgi:ABC-type lipoprotein release transport system permease subunit